MQDHLKKFLNEKKIIFMLYVSFSIFFDACTKNYLDVIQIELNRLPILDITKKIYRYIYLLVERKIYQKSIIYSIVFVHAQN